MMARRIKKRNIEQNIYLSVIGVSLAISTFGEKILLLKVSRLSAKSKFAFSMIHRLRLRLSLHEFEVIAENQEGTVLGTILRGDTKPDHSGIGVLLECFESTESIELFLLSTEEEVSRNVDIDVDLFNPNFLLKKQKCIEKDLPLIGYYDDNSSIKLVDFSSLYLEAS